MSDNATTTISAVFQTREAADYAIEHLVQQHGLIDIGARVTNIVVHSAGVPRFVRILLMGGQDITAR